MYGTVTRSAPAGRRPPKPSLQIHLFMKKPGSDQCCGKDRVVSSRQVRRLTIAPRRGEVRALRFVPSEVAHGPRSPPNAMCGG